MDERFLIYINDLLSSGYIPELFAPDEYDAMFSALRPAAKAAGVSESRDSMLQFFLSRVRANLHVVLCMSPVGEQFRTRARKFPGIINCTCIDWFQPWPKDALVSVSWALMAGDRVADEVRAPLCSVSPARFADARPAASGQSGAPHGRGAPVSHRCKRALVRLPEAAQLRNAESTSRAASQ